MKKSIIFVPNLKTNNIMKNIHIIPTDKPSRLYYWEDKLVFGRLATTPMNRNIYITNDEEIKEGDWILDAKFNLVELAKYNHKDLKRDWLKIILTTDQDLIKDGVQAIDDEFLEWFVKNPSCEEVDVITQRIFGRSSPLDTLGQTFITYKITNYEK